MTKLFSNNAASTLAAPIASTDVPPFNLQVAPGQGDNFPVVTAPDTMDLTLELNGVEEIFTISARAAASDVMTVSARALEGGTAKSWATSPTVAVELRLTASLVQSALAHLTQTTDAHAASAIQNTPAGNIASTDVQSALNELDTEKAIDSTVVHNTGNETIAGVKTFSSSPVVPDATAATQAASKGQMDAAISTAVAPLATDATVIHNTGNETLAGIKTFSSSPVVPDATVANQAASKGQMDAADAATLASAESYAKNYTDTQNNVQTIVDVTGGRALGGANTYTNSTGLPITVMAQLSLAGGSVYTVYVDGAQLLQFGAPYTSGQCPVTFPVPNGSTYQIAITAGSGSLVSWKEKR